MLNSEWKEIEQMGSLPKSQSHFTHKPFHLDRKIQIDNNVWRELQEHSHILDLSWMSVSMSYVMNKSLQRLLEKVFEEYDIK